MTANEILEKHLSKGNMSIVDAELAAMEEYASLKAEEAFNAARELHGNKGMNSWEYSTFKDYQTFKNQKP